MIGVGAVYLMAGVLFAGVAALSLGDRSNPRRWGNGLFWGLFAISFLLGDRIGDFANGCLVLALTGLAAFGGLGRSGRPPPAPSLETAARLKDRLFLPALTVPLTTLLGALLLSRVSIAGAPLIDPKQVAPVSLGLGVGAALVLCVFMLRPRAAEPFEAARRLMDAVGWAALLPQALAALGVIFAVSGMGRVIGSLAGDWLPLDQPLVAVCVFTLGMAIFTLVMGNAFAAFPVMAAAVGAPVLVRRFGGDPAVMGAVGMLSGFCGTLVTPMAANFNLVPAALLELKDRYGVIKAQAPVAVFLLIANTAILGVFVFRR